MSHRAVLAITLLSMVGMAYCQDGPDIDDASAKLFRACDDNDLELAREAIEEGADVNVVDEGGLTPLARRMTSLTRTGKKEFAELLIQHGARVDVEWKGQSLLGLVIACESTDVVRLIVETGSMPREKLGRQFPGTIDHGRPDVAEMLLDHGANINSRDDFGQTALFYAIVTEFTGWVPWLLERGAADSMFLEDGDGFYPVHLALALGKTDLAEMFFEAGYSCHHPLSQLAATGDLDAVRQAVDETPLALKNQDSARWTPLFWAVAMKNAAVAEEIMANGICPIGPVDCQELPALYYACATNQADLVATMLKTPGAESLRFPLKKSLACLMRAATLPDTAILEQLLDHGLNPAWIVTVESKTQFTAGGYGNGPIHVAAKAGNVPAMRLLVERGAGVNTPGDHLERPLHLAVRHRRLDACEWLLEKGADANAVVDWFGSPLGALYLSSDRADPNDLAIEALLKQYGGKATGTIDGIPTEVARPDNFGQVAGD